MNDPLEEPVVSPTPDCSPKNILSAFPKAGDTCFDEVVCLPFFRMAANLRIGLREL